MIDGHLGYRTRKGTVTELYPHVFLVEWDKHKWKEAFPYSMLSANTAEKIEIIGRRSGA